MPCSKVGFNFCGVCHAMSTAHEVHYWKYMCWKKTRSHVKYASGKGTGMGERRGGDGRGGDDSSPKTKKLSQERNVYNQVIAREQ